MSKRPTITIVTVTCNSSEVVAHWLNSVGASRSVSLSGVVVDCGSDRAEYPAVVEGRSGFRVVKTGNIGFSRANNMGYRLVDPETEYIVFLNPDAFPEPDTLRRAADILGKSPDIGCLGGRLLGYDMKKKQPTGLLDSTGIFRKWYGRWYDRGQGEEDTGQYMNACDVGAVCGAFMFFRRRALEETAVDHQAFDPDFFLYKEDIELSLRIKKAGWRLVYHPSLRVFHCRGWRGRKKMPLSLKKMSAANEVLLYRKHPSPYILWALVKYLVVVLSK